VYAPTGISPWGFYPFHYFWWLGVPRPIGYPYGHASVLGTLFVTVLLILLLAGIGLLVALAVRRRRRHIPLLRLDELEKRRSSG
jgi:hypothetical protein